MNQTEQKSEMGSTKIKCLHRLDALDVKKEKKNNSAVTPGMLSLAHVENIKWNYTLSIQKYTIDLIV